MLTVKLYSASVNLNMLIYFTRYVDLIKTRTINALTLHLHQHIFQIGHVNEYPTMHYFGNSRHTQSMIAYNQACDSYNFYRTLRFLNEEATPKLKYAFVFYIMINYYANIV